MTRLLTIGYSPCPNDTYIDFIHQFSLLQLFIR